MPAPMSRIEDRQPGDRPEQSLCPTGLYVLPSSVPARRQGVWRQAGVDGLMAGIGASRKGLKRDPQTASDRDVVDANCSCLRNALRPLFRG